MTRVYTIASGKGGTGKTTTTVNLGTALALLGKQTIILDADIGMANLGLVLGLERSRVTLHEVLAGEANISQAIYELPTGLKVVPSGLSLRGFRDSDPDRLQFVMRDLVKDADIVIIDAPAGINKDGVIPLAIADEVLLVVNPEIASMLDAAKVEAVVDIVGSRVGGVVINRVPAFGTALTVQKIGAAMNAPVLGVIPEDQNVRMSATFKTPVVVRCPDSPASKGYRMLAARIAGARHLPVEGHGGHPAQDENRGGFAERLARSVFGDT